MTASTSICCFELQDAQECGPARVGDRLGEVVILDHVGRLQILMIDRVVVANEREGRLVVEVLPLTLHLQMRLGQQVHCFAAAIAALLAPRHTTLGRFERPLGFAIPPGCECVVPSERVANDSIPSRCLSPGPVGGSGCIGMSAQENETYQPSASRLIVTVLGVPSKGRDQRTAMRPILDRTRKPLSSRAPLPNSL